jgi:hypothetical protein
MNHQRHQLCSAAHFMLKQSEKIDLDTVRWTDLASFPGWALWSAEQRYQLLVICGGLFCAPSIRLWIDAVKIRDVRSVLGTFIFERIMHNPVMPEASASTLRINQRQDAESLLLETGAAVLLCSTLGVFRELVKEMLPPCQGQLPESTAAKILEQGLSLYVSYLDREQGKNSAYADQQRTAAPVEGV